MKSLEPQSSKDSRHLVLVMVGDTGFAPSRVAPHPTWVAKYGTVLPFADTLKYIRKDIDGDINFANMESVISAASGLPPVPKKYNFMTHPNGARALVDAGFNLFSLANNHAFDYGVPGVKETLKYAEPLKDHGLLAYAGVGHTLEEAAFAPVFTVKDIPVAFASIGIGGSGAGRAGSNKPGQLSLFSNSDKVLLAHNLARAAADIRLLSVHHGPERYIRPTAHEVSFQRKLVLDSNANVMLGHHAHVARGIEMIDGRLIVYGLGNFNHQGTANMNSKGGCQDYSLMVKVHFVEEAGAKPVIAAVEALPINWTHMQPRRMDGLNGARRIAVLNGLSAQFDDPRVGAKGVRFMAQMDGSGIYCTAAAASNPITRNLCSNFKPEHLASNGEYRRALATCGSVAPKQMIAKALPLGGTANMRMASLSETNAVAAQPFVAHEEKAPEAAPGVTLLGQETQGSTDLPVVIASVETTTTVMASARTTAPTPEPETLVKAPYCLKSNPAHWPAGMPLAWAVPSDESAKDKSKRWRAHRYTVAEVETLLKKRGLIK
ncbi:CapA family protein [uncultured Cohaesibacter sp.]|uniref:CapA family protein n=1 Tax=uncultured Cohaesibacter sp. TaxID=1002546 RepID=UPI0029C6237F|nr:CapA family protein [uncultured Cohaesibacter sp.]